MEADQTYKYIQRENPQKKDMRKTNEFMRITTPYKTLRAYYERTGRKKAGSNQQHEDNMVLNIELIPFQGTQHETPPPETQHEAPPPETQHEAPPPETQHDPPPPETQHDPPPPEIQHETQQLLLPDHLFEELLQEIRKDPDLSNIFNDMDNLDVECQQVSNTEGEGGDDDMWDVFNICNEPTPLELELVHLH